MTRFARSKGSKASNERLPEDATSWAEMKHQLEEKKNEATDRKNRSAADAARSENYKKFLEEREANAEKSGWAEFPAQSSITDKIKEPQAVVGKKRKKSESDEQAIKKKKRKNLEAGDSVGKKNGAGIVSTANNALQKNGEVLDDTGDFGVTGGRKGAIKQSDKSSEKKIAKKEAKGKSKNKIKSKVGNELVNDIENKNADENGDEINNTEQIGKNKKRRKNANENGDEINNTEQIGTDKKRFKTRKRKKVELAKKSPDDMTEDELKIYQKKKDKKLRQVERRKKFKAENKQAKLLAKQNAENPKEHKRRKENSQVETMHINGKDIKITYFDGFPIKEEDAVRLKQLRKEMVSKGLPRSEVQQAMKLERRRAEKALTREKKNVCFNCRKAGHNLSECPELADANGVDCVADGICFKCGSTEHTHFECKVVKGDQYKYASCFICKEQGHIARQCPDNARGLYPKGGACKLCGDVTHLKKDCPKYMAEQEAKSVGLDTIGGDIEGLDIESKPKPVKTVGAHKVIKF